MACHTQRSNARRQQRSNSPGVPACSFGCLLWIPASRGAHNAHQTKREPIYRRNRRRSQSAVQRKHLEGAARLQSGDLGPPARSACPLGRAIESPGKSGRRAGRIRRQGPGMRISHDALGAGGRNFKLFSWRITANPTNVFSKKV